jgi:uncharacterized protein (TIGR03663 family)
MDESIAEDSVRPTRQPAPRFTFARTDAAPMPAAMTPPGGTLAPMPEEIAMPAAPDDMALNMGHWEPAPRLSFRASVALWLRERTPEQWAFAAIFLLGAVLRIWGLADKPLHHDESLHAYYSWQFLLNPASYQYDPLLHGPFQFHIIPLFFILGHLLGLPDNGVNDFTVRLLPALMGLAMVAMPYWLREHLGRWGALSVAFLLAVSPTFVYYSRFVRDDIYVTCCTLLLVVAAVQYGQTRKLSWLLTGTAALMISYTAMENTFFTIAIFGSFLVALVLWDLGPRVGARFTQLHSERDRTVIGREALLVPFLLIMGAAAVLGLHWLGDLSNTINALAAKYSNDATNPNNPDVIEQHYEALAVGLLLLVSIAISLAATIGLLLRMFSDAPSHPPRWHRWVDPRRQPVLDALLDTDWVRWFIAFIVAWLIFAVFFFEWPQTLGNLAEWANGFRDGLGRGLLRGIYYWLEQQHVARGGQPWYYYLILIPLYEPLALVFGLAGMVRAFVQPTRFRIFLVYWFAVTMLLYSWAGEKMPWLVIHIMLPLICLAGVALDWVIATVVRGARGWWKPTRALVAAAAIFFIGGFISLTVATTMFWAIALSVAALVAIGVAAGIERWQGSPALRVGERWLNATPRTLASWWLFAGLRICYAAALLLALYIGYEHHVLWLGAIGVVALLAAPILEYSLRQSWHIIHAADEANDTTAYLPAVRRRPRWSQPASQIIAVGCLALALALLVPTVWNMQRVTFYEPSVAPNEMLIYVQTTTDVQRVMSKIVALDKVLVRTQHRHIRIGVTSDAVWPFAWYLRDYPEVTMPRSNVWVSGTLYNYSSTTGGPLPDVILGGLDDGSQSILATYPNQFASKEYHLRWWWDESYKLPQCSKIKPTQCLTNPPLGVGVGPLLWISYGANPPAPCANIYAARCDPLNAQPNGADAAQRYWNWLWLRQNISGTSPESTDFILYINTSLTQYVGV